MRLTWRGREYTKKKDSTANVFSSKPVVTFTNLFFIRIYGALIRLTPFRVRYFLNVQAAKYQLGEKEYEWIRQKKS